MKHLVAAILYCFFCSSLVNAKEIVFSETEDGGKRVETVYEVSDNEYRYEKRMTLFDKNGHKLRDENVILANKYNNLGLDRVIKEYDKSGNARVIELVFRHDIAVINGYSRIKTTLNERGVIRKMQTYYTDTKKDERIYSDSLTFYNIVGEKTFALFYFTPDAREKTGYIRYEEEYDEDEKPLNQRFLTSDGRYK